jgi:hypothetical protein
MKRQACCQQGKETKLPLAGYFQHGIFIGRVKLLPCWDLLGELLYLHIVQFSQFFY